MTETPAYLQRRFDPETGLHLTHPARSAVIAEPEVSFVRKLFGRAADTEAHRRFAEAIQQSRVRHSRFPNVRWFTTEEDLRHGRESDQS